MMKLVSIIVVNWNGKKFIENCLASVFTQDYPRFEVIVVDNNSRDGSLELIQEKFPQIPVIKNKENAGFAKAVNQGIKASKGNYIMPLNTDIVLTENFVSEMVKVAEKDERIGSVSGKLLRHEKKEGKDVIDSCGHIIFKNRLAVNRGGEDLDNGKYDKEEFVFGTCGAAPLYKREMLEDIKLNGEYYDEDFFAFWEDIDLDWRAQLRGWRCLYTPKAVAYHYRGGIRLPRPRVIEFNNYRNRYFAIIKNDYCLGLLKNFHHILFTDFIKSGALLLRCPSALLAWIDIFKYLPKMLKKRKIIQARRKVHPKEVEREWFRKFNYSEWFRRHLR